MADPLVEQHWPALAALVNTLEKIDGAQVAVTDRNNPDEMMRQADILLNLLLSKLNRTGGPKISSRAIV